MKLRPVKPGAAPVLDDADARIRGRAPWYVVPADYKKVRDWLVAEVIADTMRGLQLRYPPRDPSIIGLEID